MAWTAACPHPSSPPLLSFFPFLTLCLPTPCFVFPLPRMWGYMWQQWVVVMTGIRIIPPIVLCPHPTHVLICLEWRSYFPNLHYERTCELMGSPLWQGFLAENVSPPSHSDGRSPEPGVKVGSAKPCHPTLNVLSVSGPGLWLQPCALYPLSLTRSQAGEG